MEFIRRGDNICEGGVRLLCWRIEYPSGISEPADRCYAEAAQAFEESCRGGICERARLDYEQDADRRKKYRRRPWEAVYSCEAEESGDYVRVKLTIYVRGGGRELLRREFDDIWERGEKIKRKKVRRHE